MELQKILEMVDHTLLAVTATEKDILSLCEDAIAYGTASVCIPPCYVSLAKAHTEGKVKVCTVIGFPNGNQSTAVKVFETEDAVRNGADEIDMVINLGWLKDRRYSDILAEIKTIRAACKGKILKVIIETCLLTEEEKFICAVLFPLPVQIILRPARAFPRVEQRERISRFLQSTEVLRSRSRQRAVLQRWRTRKI